MMVLTTRQEILRANASVKIAADLATKYRKNVLYNLEATRSSASDTGSYVGEIGRKEV